MECVQEAIQENQEQGKLKIAKFEEKHLLVGPVPTSRCRCPPARGPPPAAGAHLPEAQPLPSDDPSPSIIVPVHQFTNSGCPTHSGSSTIPGSRWGRHNFLPRWCHYPGGHNKEDDHYA